MKEHEDPRREITFNTPDEPFGLHMMGYHDFRFIEAWKFFRVSPWDAVHYVRNGRGKLFVNGKEYSVTAGDFFIIEKNESVMYYADEDDPWQYYWVDFYDDARFSFAEKLGLDAEMPVRRAEHCAEVEELFDELFSVSSSQTALYYSALSAIMRIISLEYNKGAVLKPESSKALLVDNAKKIIELNYTSYDFSVQDISKMLYVSERHIRRVFAEVVGMTPVAYISEFRLNIAANLLAKRNYTVDELCSAIGWRNRSYFMNAFKRKYNMTVKEYREGFLDRIQ